MHNLPMVVLDLVYFDGLLLVLVKLQSNALRMYFDILYRLCYVFVNGIAGAGFDWQLQWAESATTTI